MTDYVTVAEALAIHADQIERCGGSAGVRDFGLLEAALFRPQTGYYPGLIEEAAALWESLSQNHPFGDWRIGRGFVGFWVGHGVSPQELKPTRLERLLFGERDRLPAVRRGKRAKQQRRKTGGRPGSRPKRPSPP
jgi:hypothetical protein